MILVVSSEADTHAAEVMSRLENDGVPATLLDLSRFPRQARVAMTYGPGGIKHYLTDDASACGFALSECNAIWWRRPQPFQLHAEIGDPDVRAFTHNEIVEAMSGLWSAADAFWVNEPGRNVAASHKPYQLKVAQQAGLDIPETLITNDPRAAREFIARRGPGATIYKAFSATSQHWRETRLLKSDELAMVDAVKYAPVIFQEFIPARFDLRITVVGDSVFAAAVHSRDADYGVDYRLELGRLKIEPHELPASVRRKIRALMTRLGLEYGAIDMRLTPEGRYVFLEINPAGQWLFVEECTEQPITEAMTRLLAEGGGVGLSASRSRASRSRAAGANRASRRVDAAGDCGCGGAQPRRETRVPVPPHPQSSAG
jgi:glutathione synthase/RimK-type ligase-like ATP-grasp enzyme